jgi:hypothetical protein
MEGGDTRVYWSKSDTALFWAYLFLGSCLHIKIDCIILGISFF